MSTKRLAALLFIAAILTGLCWAFTQSIYNSAQFLEKESLRWMNNYQRSQVELGSCKEQLEQAKKERNTCYEEIN